MVHKKILIMIVSISCILVGCSSGGSDKDYPSDYPVSKSYTVDEIMYPSEAGTQVLDSPVAKVDYSNVNQGYVLASLKPGTSKRVKVQIGKNDQKINYDIIDTTPVGLPLQLGNGTYNIKILENIEGTQYAILTSTEINVTLDNELIPYLYPNQIVNYKAGDKIIQLAFDKVKNEDNDLKRIKAIYDFVVNYLEYDDEKAKQATQQYMLPNLDEVIEKKKGICFDYAAMMVAMLRINHIPARLVCGGTDKDQYHAWLEVYLEGEGWVNPDVFIDKKTWTLMDPTFASSKYDYDGKYVATLYY